MKQTEFRLEPDAFFEEDETLSREELQNALKASLEDIQKMSDGTSLQRISVFDQEGNRSRFLTLKDYREEFLAQLKTQAAPIKMRYDEKGDVLTVQFSQNAVYDSDEPRDGVVLDYDREGRLVALEVLNASRQVSWSEPAK